MIALIVHGGAGQIGEDRHPAARQGCITAAEVGLRVLAAGGSALDAVQAAVRALEDNPEFNAGVGSVLTRDGTVELDASIMDGAGRIGAVAAVPGLRRPVDLARAVLDDGEYVMLAGEAAWAFAREHGFAPAAPGEMHTERALRRHAEERDRRAAAVAAPLAEREGGTVGAVAIDGAGQLAAATSTGGINYKRPGRVGDSPLPGCGTWADAAGGAASATGDGEAIIRVTLTRCLVDRMCAGEDAATAAAAAIADLVRRTTGDGGVICIDRHGRLAAAHATDTMPVAAGIVEDGQILVDGWVRPRELPDLALAIRSSSSLK